MKKTFLKIVLISAAIHFFLGIAAYKSGINKLLIQSEDTLPALFMPVTIIKERTIYLDTYYELLVSEHPDPRDRSGEKGLLPFYLRKVTRIDDDLPAESIPENTSQEADEHYVSAFPIVTPLLAVPVYLIPVLSGIPITLETVAVLGRLTAALIIGFSGGFLYLLLKKHFFNHQDPAKSEKLSLLLTFIYLFATINFAHISQALWQHGTVQLFTILALLSLFDKKTFLTGLFFGLMVLTRPTAGVVVALLSLFYLIKNVYLDKSLKDAKSKWRKASRFCLLILLGILPSVLFFLWYNSAYYFSIANQGYADQIFTEWRGRFPEGFLGIWISPSKGILIYSPVLIFSLYGAYLAFKKWSRNLRHITFFSIIIVHILVYGKWKHWFGGWSFGYRMASDILPFFILLLVPAVLNLKIADFWPLNSKSQESREDSGSKKPHLCLYIFWISLIYSIFVQLYGIVFYDGMWHAAYDLGDVNTTWLWSIRNSEFAFNIRRVLVALGLRSSAF